MVYFPAACWWAKVFEGRPLGPHLCHHSWWQYQSSRSRRFRTYNKRAIQDTDGIDRTAYATTSQLEVLQLWLCFDGARFFLNQHTWHIFAITDTYALHRNHQMSKQSEGLCGMMRCGYRLTTDTNWRRCIPINYWHADTNMASLSGSLLQFSLLYSHYAVDLYASSSRK